MPYPFVAARHHGPESNEPVSRIVIHCTVSPCVPGGAQDIANYFHTTQRDASAHYVCDPSEIYQCLRETTVGYHAPPNTHSIGVELCDPQKGAGSRWQDANHEAMLVLAAGLVRDIAARHDIPLVKLDSADLLAGKRGICGHYDVTHAWHQTTHEDPGPDFPWAHFLDLVKNGNQEDIVTPDDIQAIADATARAVHARSVQVGSEALPLGLAVGRTAAAVRRVESADDPARIAAALVPLLPTGGVVTQEQLEDALRNVLGSLDAS